MNDLAFIDGWWYATSTVPCALVRFRSLDSMAQHQALHRSLGLCRTFSRRESRCSTGTPYFITKFDGRIFVPYIFGCSGVLSFVADGEEIRDVRQHWGGGWVEDQEDVRVRGAEW